jgi:hypothetical protein
MIYKTGNLEKPVDVTLLSETIKKANEKIKLRTENKPK